MKTNTISFLCRLSDRIYDNAKKSKAPIFREGVKSLVINSTYSANLTIDFDDYPELKPVAEKLIDYLIKSEESKQQEIKIAIAKEL